MSGSPVELVLSRLESVKKNGKGWTAPCPAHEDHNPSLSIKEGDDGRVLLCCRAGCPTEAILEAAGLTWSDLYPDGAERRNGSDPVDYKPKGSDERRSILARYRYHDKHGELRYSVGRTAEKDFPTWRPDAHGGYRWGLSGVTRILYHLPQVIAAIGSGEPVYIVEGEKDSDALAELGLAATCNPGGVGGKWKPEYSESLRGADVVIVADKDEPGRKHAASVAASVAPLAASVRVVEAAEGNDATDHLDGGFTLSEFVSVGVGDAVVSLPSSDTATVQPEPVPTEPPAPEGFELRPLDWQALLREGVPEVEYISEPYLPKLARIWIWGQASSMKSLWCEHEAASLSREGVHVSYFSEENPIGEELRRLAKLQPDPAHFRLFHRTGMDLADEKWVDALLAATKGDAVAFLDSWTDLWGGNEDDNRAVQQFDAAVLKPLQAQGVTPVVIHHMGHRYMFSDRGGATAGRGASSLGQKADVTLEFKSAGDDLFTIVYGKSRIGGIHQPQRSFKVEDTDDGHVQIVECDSPEERAVAELSEKAAQAVLTAPRGYLTTNELRVAVGGSRNHQAAAWLILEGDARVRAGVEKVQTKDGRLRDSKAWRPASGALDDEKFDFTTDGEPK